jgi:hypothetical protein
MLLSHDDVRENVNLINRSLEPVVLALDRHENSLIKDMIISKRTTAQFLKDLSKVKSKVQSFGNKSQKMVSIKKHESERAFMTHQVVAEKERQSLTSTNKIQLRKIYGQRIKNGLELKRSRSLLSK